MITSKCTLSTLSYLHEIMRFQLFSNFCKYQMKTKLDIKIKIAYKNYLTI